MKLIKKIIVSYRWRLCPSSDQPKLSRRLSAVLRKDKLFVQLVRSGGKLEINAGCYKYLIFRRYFLIKVFFITYLTALNQLLYHFYSSLGRCKKTPFHWALVVSARYIVFEKITEILNHAANQTVLIDVFQERRIQCYVGAMRVSFRFYFLRTLLAAIQNYIVSRNREYVVRGFLRNAASRSTTLFMISAILTVLPI